MHLLILNVSIGKANVFVDIRDYAYACMVNEEAKYN